MATKARLTTLFDGDASGVKKASQEARQAVGTFEKETGSVASKIASALGVDVDQFQKISEAAKGAGVKIEQSMAAAGKATEAQAAKVEALTTAMGVGLAAAIAAVVALWKSVKDEAEFYFDTVDGYIQKSGLDAYTETLRSLAYAHRDLEQSAGYIENLTTHWQRARQWMRNYWTELRGQGDDKWYRFLPGGNLVAGMFGATRQTREDSVVASNAAALAVRRAMAEKELLDTSIRVQQIQTEISNKMNEARLNTTDVARRQQLVSEIEGLINESYNIRVGAVSDIYETTKKINALAPTSMQDYEAEKKAEENLYRLETEREQMHFQLNRIINKNTNELANQHGEEVKGLEKATRAMQEYTAATLHQIDRNLNQEQLAAVITPITAKAVVQKPRDIIQEEFDKRPIEVPLTIEMGGEIEGLVSSYIDGITTAFANAMTGEEDFGTGMLRVLADMAVQVGEIAVATGLAVSGIKAALETLQPEIAIAAGAALIAVGKWAGSALSKSAGGSSTSTSYGGGSYGGYGQADFNVQISGEFEFKAGALQAAINNENTRKQYIG